MAVAKKLSFEQRPFRQLLVAVLLLHLGLPALAQEEISQIPFETIPIQTTFASTDGICLAGPVKIDSGVFGDTSLRILDGDLAMASSGETAIRMRRTALGRITPLVGGG